MNRHRNKAWRYYGIIGAFFVFLVVASGCACYKQQPLEDTLVTEEVSPAPTPREQEPVPPAIVEIPLYQQARDAGALQNIYFDFDKHNLTSDSVAKLDTSAAWLKKNGGRPIVIEGHCDERGTNEYNMALGERRANSAMNYLVSLGVPAENITTVSYGEERPVDPGRNETAWAKNRRDEFKLAQ